MYNEFEEYSLNTKMNFKVWKRIFKEMFKYPWLLIGSIVSMIGSAFCETMFVKFVCSDGLAQFMDEGLTTSFWIFVVKMVKGQSIEKISSVITISSVVLNCVYMINGFLTKSTADEVLDGYGEIHTYAYIPFILAVVLVVAYFLLKAFLPEEMGAKAKAQQSAKSENQALQTLLQYKALLDSGVITQEEFEAKKAELLPSHGLPTTPVEEMTTQETISVESLPEKVSCVCPLCRARFKIKYEHIGKRVRCLACQEVVTATPATEQY